MWQKIKNPDVSILGRLTEQDIAHWLAAKLASLPAKHQVDNIQIGVSFQDRIEETGVFDIEWTVQGGGACAVINPTFDDGFSEHQQKLKAMASSDPAELRRKAAALLTQAERLEKSTH